MPDVLLDSDVIIEVLRGNSRIVEKLTHLRQEGRLMAYTPIAKAEIYHGVRHGEEKSIEAFFSACRSLPITDDVGEQAGHYLAAYHRSHGVEIADALVAAAAFVHQTELFTLNRKHYPMKNIRFHS